MGKVARNWFIVVLFLSILSVIAGMLNVFNSVLENGSYAVCGVISAVFCIFFIFGPD